MAAPVPQWRQVFDAAERNVTPHLESLVRTEHFARAAAIATWAQSSARGRVEGLTARLWHLVNLPAGTDVVRLRAQIGALDREVRRLTVALEQQQDRPPEEETVDAVRPQPVGGPRPHPARRRTQHPAGP